MIRARTETPRKSRTPKSRDGFNLLELVAVITIIGIVAAVGMARFGAGTLGNLGAQSDARRVAIDLLQARRRAISTGDNHFVQFTPSSGAAVSYAIVRRVGAGTSIVEATREIADDVTVTSSAAECEFSFDGTALAAYLITVAGPDRSWQVSVVPASGAVRVTSL